MLGLLFAGAYIGTSSHAKAQRVAGLVVNGPHACVKADMAMNWAYGNKKPDIESGLVGNIFTYDSQYSGILPIAYRMVVPTEYKLAPRK